MLLNIDLAHGSQLVFFVRDLWGQIQGFDWKNCGLPDAPAVLKTLTVSPDPIVIPGDLTASASGSTSVELSAPLSVSTPIIEPPHQLWKSQPLSTPPHSIFCQTFVLKRIILNMCLRQYLKYFIRRMKEHTDNCLVRRLLKADYFKILNAFIFDCLYSVFVVFLSETPVKPVVFNWSWLICGFWLAECTMMSSRSLCSRQNIISVLNPLA